MFIIQALSLVGFLMCDIAANGLKNDQSFFSIHNLNSRSSNQADEIYIDFNTSLHACDKKYLSLTIDSSEIMSKWKGFDFSSSKLRNMASALSPANIRIGGTNADFLIFEPNGDELLPKSSSFYDSGYFDFKAFKAPEAPQNFTMTGKQWDNMTSFFKWVRWDLMFDFNVFLRRDGVWDPVNAQTLLDYSAARGIEIPAFQLGNEPNAFLHNFNISILPPSLARDFIVLKQLLSNYSQYRESGLYGPDVTSMSTHSASADYFKQFLNSGACSVVNAATFHQYYKDGRKTSVDDFLNTTVMDSLKKSFEAGQEVLKEISCPLALALTETSSCYGGGAPGLSDRYVAGFLWLDKLGLAAQYGITTVYRQTFFGGSYALVNNNLDPAPDFYLSVLYKRLAAGPVFHVSKQSEQLRVYAHCAIFHVSKQSEQLRVYAHCASNEQYPPGALVVYFMNIRNTTAVLSLSQFTGLDKDVFLLTPGDADGLKSRFVKLNDELLLMSGSELPPMLPTTITGDVTVTAQSFGFIIVPAAKVSLCIGYHEKTTKS
ncbi:unnamed protein product [Lymnaea stagnalis]|uniref:Heparanase n=1 Tax=Lymnaea stagnalis TaxID=6523 RepID=A0AAV2I1S5_LYMST